ncbi:MAG: family 20 glycosylhydrolase [Armatimonadetes bacterium]|nr:family 20 glycosylhydrolase [Armatimonadota bacterium]
MFPVLAAVLGLAPSLHLIPDPQSVVQRQGTFPLGTHAAIVVVRPKDADDSYAAEQLIEESPTSFGWGKARKRDAVVLVGQLGRDTTVSSKIRSLGLKLPKDAPSESYVLSVRPGQIVCAGNSAAGTFYAVQTLRQLIRSNKVDGGIPCLDIVDWPMLQIRGWQDDVSRGPIPTLAFLKKQVRELSSYKLNAFTLYTEHIFKLKKHPTIAPKDGLTAEEVKDLDNYCKKHHVQLIGNFQSFGHFANILSVPGYEKLGETTNVISPAKEESYAFLKDVYDEIAPAYSSPLFNINCDETYGLGEGAAKEMVKKEGLGRVYAKHINRVADLLRSHGKTCMMWGDIALQHSEIRSSLPKDLIVLTWGYHPGDDFDDQILPFTKIGFKFLVCPGVSCWGQVFPDLDAATKNISNFTRDGFRFGALGVLNTTWDDTGENLFNNNWYPLVWGAEVAWKPALAAGGTISVKGNVRLYDQARKERNDAFDESFPRLFCGLNDGKLSKAFWKLSRLRTKPVSGGMSDQAFWTMPWDIDTATAKSPANNGLSQDVMDAMMAIQHAKRAATRNAETLDAAYYSVSKEAYLSSQAKAMSEFGELMQAPAEFRSFIAEQGASSLAGQLSKIEDEYRSAWALENRPWWLDRNVSKYERLKDAVAGLALLPVFDTPQGALSSGKEVKIVALVDGATVRYTTDGTEPNGQSSAVTGPIKLQASTRLKAAAFTSTGKKGPTVERLYTMPTKPGHIETSWSSYGEHVPAMAFDGLDSTYFWSYGQPAKNSSFTIVFDEADLLEGLTVTTGHPDHPEDYLKEGVLEVSPDGQKWREMAKFEKGVAHCGLINLNVKAVRIRLTKDNGNWLVIREISLK